MNDEQTTDDDLDEAIDEPELRSEETEDAKGRKVPLVAVLGVAVVVLAVLLAVTYMDRNDLEDRTQRTDDIAAVASDFGVTLYTYDYRDIEGQLAHMEELSTPSFAEEYRDSFEANLQAQIQERQVVSNSELTDVLVSRSDGDQARAIVIVSTSVTRENGATATISGLIDISMLRVDGQWRVDKVLTIANDGTITDADGNPIDVGDATEPDSGTGSTDPESSSVTTVPDETEQEPAGEGE